MDPRAEYRARAARLRDDRDRVARRFGRVALLRLAGFIVLVAGIWLGFRGQALGPWIAGAGLAIFVGAVSWHARLARRRGDCERAIEWYEAAERRLDSDWAGEGFDGANHTDPEHPYSGELDLYGRGSVFQWLCHAVSDAGRERLARWLAGPAAVEELAERRDAVRELVGALGEREEMVLRAPHRPAPPRALVRWLTRDASDSLALRRAAAAVAATAQCATLILWLGAGWSASSFLISAIVAFAVSRWAGRGLDATTATLDESGAELRSLEGLLRIVEHHRGESARMRRIAEALSGAAAPSARIRSLRLHLDMFDSARNQLFAPFAALLLWRTQWGLAIEAWRRRWGASLDRALDALADYEALQSFARAAFEHPDDVEARRRPRGDRDRGRRARAYRSCRRRPPCATISASTRITRSTSSRARTCPARAPGSARSA